MKRALPKYVYPKLNGRYYYFERGGQSVRMENTPNSPEFWAEYSRLLRGDMPPPASGKRTIGALVASYKRTEAFASKKPRTKQDYDKVLSFLAEKIGHLPADKMQRKDVIRLRDANSVSFGNYCLKVVRIIMEHAIDIGWRQDNPAKGAKLRKVPKERKLPRQPWPSHMLEAYRAAAPLGTRQRLVMELCLGTGQRIGDVLSMMWSDYDGEAIRVEQNKTDKKLTVPVTPRLREALSAAERRSVFILTNYQGTGQWSYRGASDAVMKVRRKIGADVDGMDIHAWRHNAASELKSVGCDAASIEAVTGMSKAVQARYTATVTQIDLAKKAQERRK